MWGAHAGSELQLEVQPVKPSPCWSSLLLKDCALWYSSWAGTSQATRNSLLPQVQENSSVSIFPARAWSPLWLLPSSSYPMP